MGTPPALVLKFSVDGFVSDGSGVLVDYTIINDGEGDLENCKIQLAIETTTSNYTYWTGGVNLSKGKSHSVDEEHINVGGTTNAVYVIAAGFDDYSKSSTSPGRTIIYYDKQIKQ